MTVSYFDLTYDLKCSVLSPSNFTAIKKRHTSQNSFWVKSHHSHQNSSPQELHFTHKITFQVFNMQGMDPPQMKTMDFTFYVSNLLFQNKRKRKGHK